MRYRVLLLLAGCASDQDAIEAAKLVGWSDVTVTGRDYALAIGCGDGETRFNIAGKNAAGASVHGLACCGAVFKGCTVRTER